MNKLFWVLILAMPVSTVLWADAGANGCLHSNNKGNGCAVAMPEPSAIPELVLCAAGIAVLAVYQRKLSN